eukprot:1203418-Rhodomonas_salina.1
MVPWGLAGDPRRTPPQGTICSRIVLAMSIADIRKLRVVCYLMPGTDIKAQFAMRCVALVLTYAHLNVLAVIRTVAGDSWYWHTGLAWHFRY